MGCGTCSTSSVAGETKSSCGTAAKDINGVNKLQVYDWLSNIDLPAEEAIHKNVELRFKNSRKEICSNPNSLHLFTGDVVVLEAKPGYDIAVVSLTGRLVNFQLKRKRQNKVEADVRKVIRKASQEEIDKWKEGQKLELPAMLKVRALTKELNLNMKVSDVEYQADLGKATFYYTAEDRVDFRELIKKMADEFKVRIEMKQIGARQEASRLGGIGSCGRELCCSTWLSDFRSVSTSSARYQQLSLNPQKLTGQCGKLKCCLNYELDMYMENIKELPDSNIILESEAGQAVHFKTDIFKKEIWYVMRGKEITSPFPLTSEQVHEVIQMNKKGEKPFSFMEMVIVEEVEEKDPDYSNVDAQDSLNRFDVKKTNKKKWKSGSNSKKNRNSGQNNSNNPPSNKVNQHKANPNHPNPNKNNPNPNQPSKKAKPNRRPDGKNRFRNNKPDSQKNKSDKSRENK